jgi:hypothetical protein
VDDAAPTLLRSVGSDPIEGWRTWRLVRRGGEAALGSLFSPEERWTPRTAARAVCAVESSYHPAPAIDCRCGYYAYAERARLAGASRRGAVIGAVAMWGEVIGHDFGYRAEYAYPQRLRLVCGPCLRIGRDRPPRWVVERREELTVVCARHTPRLRGRSTRLPAAGVEAELLGTYAVELLPPTGLSAPPLHRRASRAIRAFLGAKTSIGWMLVALLVAGLAFRAASGASDGAPGGVQAARARVSAGEGDAATTVSTIAPAPHRPVTHRQVYVRPSAGVVLRTACGVGPQGRIRVVPCSQDHDWTSTAAFREGILPKCFGAVIETRPDGRNVCWVAVHPKAR